MIFDTVNTIKCIPGTGGTGSNGSGGGGGSGGNGGGGPADPRCDDAAFAAANPSICGNAAYIVLKPASSIIAVLGAVQFSVFLYQNGVETPVSTNLLFGSSDPATLALGASSGNGTGLKSGNVVVTATYQGLSATASVTVVDSTTGCSETPVATAVVLDNSLSMSQPFGGGYRTLLDFAKAAATGYAGTILNVSGQPKDSLAVYSFNNAPTQLSSGFISDTTLLTSLIAGVSQSQADTDLSSAITAAATDLQATSASVLVMLILSDGQQTDSPSSQSVLNSAAAFIQAGGIIICIGCRAAGPGFDLLERCATGGFFINATSATAAMSLGGLSYLKSAVCAGACVPAGDFYEAAGALDYSSFQNWSVIAGQVNLLGNGFIDLLPGNGLYVELANSGNPATIESIDTFTLNPGDTYELAFELGGNNEVFISSNPTVLAYVRDVNSGQKIFQQTVSVAWNAGFQRFQLSFTAQYAASVRLGFAQQVAPGTTPFEGNLLDDITFTDITTSVTLLADDFDEENIVYVPPACGPSLALPALANPVTPIISFINYAGGAQLTGETYKYAISYKTQQGETALSPVASTASLTPVTMSNQSVLIGGIGTAAYPVDRITEIRIWRNDASGSSTLYLLATLTQESINYIDGLSHAQFAAIVDTGIIAPTSNTTDVASGALGFGTSGCYEATCEPAVAVGAQTADPNPLPNIETGGGSGGGSQFTSTQQVCGSCPGGVDLNSLAYTSLVFVNTIPSGYPASYPATIENDSVVGGGIPNLAIIGVLMQSGGLPTNPFTYEIDGSVDGTTWVSLASGILAASQFLSIPYSGGAIIGAASIPIPGFITYPFYRAILSAGDPLCARAGFTMMNASPLSNPKVCKTATASSSVSQQAADATATAAAQQALNTYLASNCIVAYASTKSYTAMCACGQLGAPVTKTATSYSFVSQADADGKASASATSAANAALVCTLSNNAQLISLPDTADNGPASPYPSVAVVNGFVGNSAHITVKLSNIITGDLGNFDLLLVSPTGKTCVLKSATPQSGLHFVNNAAWTVTFDDAAPTALPLNSLPANNISYKPTQTGVAPEFPGCVSNNVNFPYGTTLAAVTGDSPNGSWSLWVRSLDGLGHVTTIAGWVITIT